VDDAQILQVVLNIVINAIDASPRGGRVALRVQEAETPLLPGASAASWLRIEVQDQGPGIPESERDKLFDPFFTTKAYGTGLGLSVSQKIIEEHHGVIHVRSEAGRGSRFIVELPREFECGVATVAAQTQERGA
jgi:signal transduction histidine kinase